MQSDGRAAFAESDVRLLRFDVPDAPTNEQATAHLRVTVKGPVAHTVGRAFSNATMELALGGLVPREPVRDSAG